MALRPALVTAVLALACSLGACEVGTKSADAIPTPPGTIVDSALPIDTLLRRFRATLADTPSALAGGAESPEALARALLIAVGRRDTATLRSLVMTRAEFVWLYYPHSRYTAPPYELGPDLVWIPMIASSEKGAGRLLARYGGRPLRFKALICTDSAVHEGPNTIEPGCGVSFAVADSAPRTLHLFGSVLGRDRRYKFLSYANDL